MSNVKEYFRKKQEDLKALAKRERRAEIWDKYVNNKGSRIRIAVIAGALLIMMLIGLVVYNNARIYTDYTVPVISARNDTSSTKYIKFNGKILKYSLDGVSYVDLEDNAIWTHTYSMQSPIIDMAETTVAIGEQKGNQIYIYNVKGLIGKISTASPILKVKVTEQGNVMVVLEDSDKTQINLYDSSGEEIAGSSASIAQTGYPLDISITPDSKKTMLSYLSVNTGLMTTKIAFYNYGAVRSSEGLNLVNSITYENCCIPEIKFLDNSTAIAFRDNGFSVYKGLQIPDEMVNIEFVDEIQSTFYSSNNIGFVFISSEEEEKYRLEIYNLDGELVFSEDFRMDYTRITMDENQIIIQGDTEWCIYNTKGKLIYSGEFEQPIIDIFTHNRIGTYTVIVSNAIMEIKLK